MSGEAGELDVAGAFCTICRRMASSRRLPLLALLYDFPRPGPGPMPTLPPLPLPPLLSCLGRAPFSRITLPSDSGPPPCCSRCSDVLLTSGDAMRSREQGSSVKVSSSGGSLSPSSLEREWMGLALTWYDNRRRPGLR